MFLAAMLFFVGGASAEDYCDPCVVRVAPNTTLVHVPLAGWAGPSDLSQALVEAPPAHGIWSGSSETYIPGPSFAAAGMDQMSVSLETPLGTGGGRRTLIFVLEAPSLDLNRSLTFSNYSHWNQIEGWVVDGVGGPLKQSTTGNVLPVIARVGVSSLIQLHDWMPGADISYASAGTDPYADPDPISISNWLAPEILNLDGVIRVVSEIDGAGQMKVRATAKYPYFNCGGSDCETTLLNVPAPSGSTRYYVEVEAAQRVIGHPTEKNWTVHLWVKELGTDAIYLEDEIEIGEIRAAGWPTTGNIAFGAMNTTASAGDQGGFANIEFGWMRVAIGSFDDPAQMTFTDFDPLEGIAGDVAGEEVLISTGTVGRNRDRANTYRYIDVDAMTPVEFPSNYVTPGGDDLATLTDFSPVQAKEVVVELDLVASNLPAWTTANVLEIGRVEGALHIGPANLLMKKNSAGFHELRLRTSDDHLVWHKSDWLVASSDRMRITIRLKIDDSGPGEPPNGEATLVLDDQSFTISNLENSAYPVEFVSLGTWWLRYSGAAPSSNDLGLKYDNLVITYE